MNIYFKFDKKEATVKSTRSTPMPSPLDRIFEAVGCRTQTELAEFLGIRQSSIADAKKRGSIPSDWLLTLWRKKGVNPDWILWGQGAKRLQPVDFPEAVVTPAIYIKEIRPPEECSIEQLIEEIIRRMLRKMDLQPTEPGKIHL